MLLRREPGSHALPRQRTRLSLLSTARSSFHSCSGLRGSSWQAAVSQCRRKSKLRVRCRLTGALWWKVVSG
jgi:hypothetical protein